MPLSLLTLRAKNMRPAERRAALGAFFTLFGVMTGHALLETARDALFLGSLPASRLPWVYLGIAVLSLLLMSAQRRLTRRYLGSGVLVASLLSAAVITMLFWVALPYSGNAGLFALYLWSSMVATLVMIQFWGIVSGTFTVTQAKRVFSFIGTGGVLGAIAGSAIAGLISQVVHAHELLVAAAMALAASSLPALVYLSRDMEEPESASPTEQGSSLQALRLLRDYPYPRHVSVLVLVSAVALVVADYVFKATVASAVAPEDLSSFFATAYFVLNGVSLLVQVAVVGRVVRSIGIVSSVMILPVLLSAGAVLTMFGGGLAAVLLLKLADGGLRHSLHRTTTELLFVPMIDKVRQRVKRVIDVLAQRGGQALGALIILGAVGLGADEQAIAVVLVALLALWAGVAASLRKPYLDIFRRTLRNLAIDTRLRFPELDLESVESLMAALNSTNDAEVLAALEVLESEGKVRLVPALILYHPSEDVVVAALEMFARAGRTDFIPIGDRMLGEATPVVHAALVRARTAVAPDDDFLEVQSGSFCSSTRATSAVYLYARGQWDESRATVAFDAAIESDNPMPKLAIARAARYAASAEVDHTLLDATLVRLASHDDPRVRVAAVEAMSTSGQTDFVPAILERLVDRHSKPAARRALVEMGSSVLPHLDEALDDSEVAAEVKWQIPAVVSRIDDPAVVGVLQRRLVDQEDGQLEYRVIRALERVVQYPNMRLDHAAIEEAATTTMATAFRYLRWRLALEAGAPPGSQRRSTAHALLVRLLRDKEMNAIERLIRLEGLFFPDEDFGGILRGLASRQPTARASSRELLEALVHPEMRPGILALVDDTSDETRLLGDSNGADGLGTYEDGLRAMQRSTSDTLRGLAFAQAAFLNLPAQTPIDDVAAAFVAPSPAAFGLVPEVAT